MNKNHQPYYEAPEINVTEIFSEGLLCMSGTGSFNDLNEDTLEW